MPFCHFLPSISAHINVCTLCLLDYIYPLRVSLLSYFICTVRLYLVSSVVTYHPTPSFINHSLQSLSNIQRDSIVLASDDLRTPDVTHFTIPQLSEMDISIVFHALLWVAALGRYAQSPGMFEWRPCDEGSSALVRLFRRKCAATSWTTSRTVWTVHGLSIQAVNNQDEKGTGIFPPASSLISDTNQNVRECRCCDLCAYPRLVTPEYLCACGRVNHMSPSSYVIPLLAPQLSQLSSLSSSFVSISHTMSAVKLNHRRLACGA